jgi:prolyl-tRNA editing enzyme YbaK/EbsC (Cys-tRNA(Pro) deacylase)
MSLESVRAYFLSHAPDITVLVTETSSATVEEAANTHGVEPARIAKTLSLRVGDRVVLVVTSGTARLDNRKVKDTFGGRASMLGGEEVEAITGHPVGGVCPFGLKSPLPVYCDVSLKAFDEVVPAAGARNSAVRINTQRMVQLIGAEWVDVCKDSLAAAAQ